MVYKRCCAADELKGYKISALLQKYFKKKNGAVPISQSTNGKNSRQFLITKQTRKLNPSFESNIEKWHPHN